jgi:hypothetical protein
MRASLMMLLCAGVLGCGDTSGNTDMMAIQQDLSMPTGGSKDMAMKVDSGGGGLETLTVNNTLSWCTVIVTIGNGTPTTFTDASKMFMAAAGTTVNLQADPLPGFIAVKWTGVSTMNGDKATYVVTGSATQSVTACCPHTNGTGC